MCSKYYEMQCELSKVLKHGRGGWSLSVSCWRQAQTNRETARPMSSIECGNDT